MTQHYDIAIIGLGPAGSALARILGYCASGMRIIALDKKHQHDAQGFMKPCGGLLAPDAQRSFIRSGVTLPISVIASPQIFSVRTIDCQSGLIRNYQRNYININRHAFDLWLKSLIPPSVSVYHNALCQKIGHDGQHWHLTFTHEQRTQEISARFLVGADGANSMVRRYLYPEHHIRKYIAIQQWFPDSHPTPFYSCIFDNTLTDSYSWSISKNGHFIFGGAFPMKNSQQAFNTLKQKMSGFGFRFGRIIKTEKCAVLYPSRHTDFICGKNNAFLAGEAAGFISASSLEGISYALDSAELLSAILTGSHSNASAAYWHSSRKLRRKLFGKIIKSHCLTSPLLRSCIMKSRFAHIQDNNLPGHISEH